MRKVASTLLIAVIGGFSALAVYTTFFNEPQKVVQLIEKPQTHFINSAPVESTDFTVAAERSVHAVVHVKTQYLAEAQYNPLMDFFFGDKGYSEAQPSMASGSGVIISADGYIVTNNHVIDRSEYIEVAMNDNRTFRAKLIGTDPTTDLALLKIDAEGLPTIPYGDSEKLKVGEWVLAVGNPFNLTSTVTAGIVSAKARNINILNTNYAIESFIQTDAAVNPGNSGGALVNVKGDLVGINTAIASRTGSYTGYSFAVPVTIVKKVVNDLIEYGVVQRAVLGVSIRDLTEEIAKAQNLDLLEGVFINKLTTGGAAADAGIKVADVIIKVAGVSVKRVAELQEQISKYRPGDKVSITVNRKGKLREIEVLLRNKHGNTEIIDTDVMLVLGGSFEEISLEEKNKIGIKHGVKVMDIEAGKLMKAGIKEGFIIRFVNRKAVSTPEDIQKALGEAQGGVYIEGVYPNGMSAYYAFGMK